MAVGIALVRNTLSGGKIKEGVLPSGQVVGRLNDIPTCQELIERIVSEAEKIIESMQSKLMS